MPQAAARQVTGRAAVIPSVTKLTPIHPGILRLRVEICRPGDTRPRKRGLPDALGPRPAFAGYPNAGRTCSNQHRCQVTSLASGRRGWLGYPGHMRAVPTWWQVEGTEICLQPPRDTFNPVTGGWSRAGPS